MKKFCQVTFKVFIALALLGISVKFLMHFLGNMEEENEESHREPYQPEEE